MPNKMYGVKVELMMTDLDTTSEYADITIDGVNYGTCNPSGSQMSCQWYTCTGLSQSQVTTASSSVSIQIQYSSGVNDLGDCTADGLSGHGVARITLIP